MSTQAEYSDGDKLYGVDMDNIVEALSKDGVLTGWTLAQNATPNMSVDVASGTGFIGGVYNTTVSTTNVVFSASHGSLDRLDIIVVNNAGAISAIAGTPASSPNPPDLPDNNICLAIIEVDATVTAIFDADIISKRLLLGTIKDQMLDTNVAFLNKAETVTGAWTFQGTVNFENHLLVEAGKLLQFAASGETITGSLKGDTTYGMRAGSGMLFHDGYKLQFGDGSAVYGHIVSDNSKFKIKDNNNVEILTLANGVDTTLRSSTTNIQVSTTQAFAMLVMETTGAVGGIRPDIWEQGNVGDTSVYAFNTIAGKYLFDDDGVLGSYSERDDLQDLRSIKELYHPETGEKVRGSWGDPIFDAATIPKYIRSKQGYEKFGEQQYDPDLDKIVTKPGTRPNRGYISNSKWKGWMISLLQKLDGRDREQNVEIEILKAEILALKEQIQSIGG